MSVLSAGVAFPGLGAEKAYQAERHALLVERTRSLAKIALFIYPAFWFFDRLKVPDSAAVFLAVRLTVVAVLLLTWALTRTAAGRRRIVPLSMLYILIGSYGISLMAAYDAGFSSSYYVGLLLILYGAGLYNPWTPLEAFAFAVLHVGGYFAVLAAWHPFGFAALDPLFFLGGAAAILCASAVSSEASRRRAFLLRAQVEAANRDLKVADEAKTRFFSNVSHELRTPLTLILSPLEEMLAGSRPTDRRLLSAMAASARRLLRQVNALLNFAKLEAGDLRCHLEEGSIAQIAVSLVEAAEPHAARRGITLRHEAAPELGLSLFDPDKIETVIANLLSNAIKFTPEGGSVTVRVGAVDAAVRIEVEDSGVGIPADQIEHIFERFHQVDASMSRAFEGTGLGLALVKELVRLHGGQVTVESEAGRGSRFTALVPTDPARMTVERRQGPRRKADRVAVERQRSLLARVYGQGRTRDTLLADIGAPQLADGDGDEHREQGPEGAARILLVEDNADLRAFVARHLAATYRVESAVDGQDGLERALRRPPSLVISDVMMPRLSGQELCRRLRDNRSTRGVPIILMTARAGTEDIIGGLETGADDYVTKPFDVRELKARADAHLRARALESELGERESRLAAIGGMASAIVHDLRTPLTAVVGYTHIARMDAEAAGAGAVLDDLTALERSAGRLQRMLSSILDFARGGSTRIAPSRADLGAWLASVAPDLRSNLEGTRIELDVDGSAAAGVTLRFDRDQLHRILENLVLNARDALTEVRREAKSGPRGRIVIHVERGDGTLRIRVADNGPGIPEAVRERLFQPFVSSRPKGTGLGLATVKNLVLAHGWRLQAELDPPGGGAAFVIEATDPEAAPAVALPALSKEAVSRP